MTKPKKYRKHKTQKIAIKMVEVDEKMVPVINWLNSFEGIYTRWCCEGDITIQKPYVVFYADNLRDLGEIVRHINGYGVVEVDNYVYMNVNILRYYIRFDSKIRLKRFKTTLPVA